MAPKPKVLLLGTIDHAPAREAYESLAPLADLITTSATNPTEFLSECRSGALAGVKHIYRTFSSVSITGRIEGEIAHALGKDGVGVKSISHNGAGYDQLSPPACTTAHISISHVPTAVNAATADTALFLLLGALRNFQPSMLALRNGAWRGAPPPALGHDPEGKTLGILGMGGIGQNLARKAQALGMSVVYHNRRKLEEGEEGGARWVVWEEVLRGSDVLSVNLPLNESTHHLLSTREFAKMKPSAIIINTARGAVIDEAALVAALEEGRIASAGLDVYEEEPEVHQGLIGNPRVVLLPHMGTWSVETQTAMELFNVANIRSMLETGKLKSRIPEQKDMPYD